MRDEQVWANGPAKDRMIAGEFYAVGTDAPELHADWVQTQLYIEEFNGTSVVDTKRRQRLLEQMLGEVGDDSIILPPLQVDYGYQLHVGNRVFINHSVTIAGGGRVDIGDDSGLGPNVQIMTALHPLDIEGRRKHLTRALPTVIGKGVWLGAGSLVYPGVSIGDGTIVSGGAVVTKDLPPFVLAIGNPARAVQKLERGPEDAS